MIDLFDIRYVGLGTADQRTADDVAGLDEATEGLAPLVRLEIWRCLKRLKATGLAMIVIDRHVGALRAQPDVLHQYVGV